MHRFFGLLLIIFGEPSLAQHSIQFHVFDESTRQPIPGASVLVLPEHQTSQADSAGRAVITGLSPGAHRFNISSPGYRDNSFSLMLQAADTDCKVYLELLVETMQNAVITSTRSNRLLKNTAITVQVVDKEDIEEGTAESPSNIRELLTELSGTQVRQTSPTSGNVAIRLQGLDERYTQLLKDGFPLYGGFSGSLSILQVPPLDLRQVEVIKGAGSALYGGDAIAGIINLISRVPDTIFHLDAIVNQTDRGGTDLGGYYSFRKKRAGMTVMTSVSRQTPFDVDKDGFTDLPKVRQACVAPDLFWYPDDSTTIRLGLNIFSGDRAGGDLQAVRHGADSAHPFLQENHSDRDYYQLTADRRLPNGQRLQLKNSTAYFYRGISQHTGEASYGFGGSEISSFSEASYSLIRDAHQIVAGTGLVTDRFKPDAMHAALGYTHITPGVFVQDDWNLARSYIIEAGARADWDQRLYFLPRLAVLYRPIGALTIRLGGGMAYKLPTVFDAADEQEAYQQVYPITTGIRTERSVSANLSFNFKCVIGQAIGFTIDQNFYYTRLTNALVEQPDSLIRGWVYFVNATGPVVSQGSETVAQFSLDDLTLHLGYTYSDTRRIYLPGRPPLPLTPHSRLVSTLSYEAEPHWKLAAEGFYTGVETLDNGMAARSFWTFDFSVQRSLGRFAILFNIENIGDTRQSKFGPVYSGTPQNPLFNEVYAPLDGRVISVAFRYSR